MSATVLIRSVMPHLTVGEQKVAEAALISPRQVAYLSVSDLAKQCGVSEATIVRFAKRVGYDGYRQLRLALAVETGRNTAEAESVDIGIDVTPGDSIKEIVTKVGAADAQAIAATIAYLDVDELADTLDALTSASRVEVFGVGASRMVAEDLEAKLRRINRNAWTPKAPHEALATAALLDRGDVAMAISHSGETDVVVDFARGAKAAGATVVGLTNYLHSRLGGIADITLVTASPETKYRAGASRVAQLTVIDCIFVGLFVRLGGDAETAMDKGNAALDEQKSG